MAATGSVPADVVIAVAGLGGVRTDYDLTLRTKVGNTQIDRVPDIQIDRRLLTHTRPRRCTRGDDISGLKAHELTNVGDQERRPENHRARRAGLKALAIDVQPHIEVAGVGEFVCCNEPRANRAETIAALAFVPLPSSLQLKRPFRNIVAYAITRNRGQSCFL